LRTGITVILFFILTVFFDQVFGQSDSSISTSSNVTAIHASKPAQRDLIDVARSLKKHPTPRLDSATKKIGKIYPSIVPAVGYTLSTGWAAILASNVGFYTADPTQTNISSLTSSIVYSQYNQTTIPLQANIWTKNNRYNYVSDLRYYKYPQDTYGLGGHSSLADADLIDYNHVRVHQSVLKNLLPYVYGGFGYFLDYHWNIKESGLPDGDSSDAQKYGLNPTSMSSGPVINVFYDNRSNSINPSGGLYANLLYRANLTLLASNSNWQSLLLDIRKYWKFPQKSNNILAVWSYDWLTLSGKPPYLDLPSTGWDAYNNTGRGYIQGRFRGKDMIYLETEYRFGITSNGLFGGVVFANAQCFSEYPSNDFDIIWPGVGLGLRIKVNKQSGANIAIDYGFGADGSHGLFVNIGEVF
jgi:hypothetical protein